jgi:hypothetical protein
MTKFEFLQKQIDDVQWDINFYNNKLQEAHYKRDLYLREVELLKNPVNKPDSE